MLEEFQDVFTDVPGLTNLGKTFHHFDYRGTDSGKLSKSEGIYRHQKISLNIILVMKSMSVIDKRFAVSTR